ncbi:MAG TPA: hypothetical protein DCG57_10570 [Candidatus Riflebacteria bacterium]|jgi:hypothetical protein|nr:hypothetical protein [Candidatus Riflebacteria bacterium]
MNNMLHRLLTKLVFVLVIAIAFFNGAVFGTTEKDYTPDPAITARIAENPQIIHEKLTSSMNKLLNTPATLTIVITPYNEAGDKDCLEGRFKRVEVHTSRGQVENLFLHQADIEFEDVQLDTRKLLEEDKIDPVSMRNINMDVIIKETDMNSFLEAKSKSIKVSNPEVKLLPDTMELSGSTKYGMVKVEFWATGKLSVKDGKEIHFHANRMKVNRMTMPRSFVGMIIKKINPVLNLDKFPFKLNLSEIKITRGEMNFTSYRKGSR